MSARVAFGKSARSTEVAHYNTATWQYNVHNATCNSGLAIRSVACMLSYWLNQVRRRLSEMAEAASLSMIVPQPKYCVDNGVMVAWESGPVCVPLACLRQLVAMGRAPLHWH
jgi:hypothetical protein